MGKMPEIVMSLQPIVQVATQYRINIRKRLDSITMLRRYYVQG